MSAQPLIVIVVQRIGPHHHARFEALAKHGNGSVLVIETRPKPDVVNMWEEATVSGTYQRVQLKESQTMSDVLTALTPAVIICVGYSDPEIHSTIRWAFYNGIRLVTCSDSTYDDQRRSLIKEMLKRMLVSSFDGALVAGRRSHDYMNSLGIKESSRFAPWDVVDNRHFAAVINSSEEDRRLQSAKLGWPPDYFLFVGRFIPEKNLKRFIEAYRRYRDMEGDGAWPLMMSGAGPLEGEVRAQVQAAGLERFVILLGFLRYEELPAYYGLANALVLTSVSETWGLVVNEAMAAGLPVLVSSRCGCAPDLVKEGENGFTFDPTNVEEIAACLLKFHRLDAEKRRNMGRKSQEIIAAYSPEAFARGHTAALKRAGEGKYRRKNVVTRLAVRFLAARKT